VSTRCHLAMTCMVVQVMPVAKIIGQDEFLSKDEFLSLPKIPTNFDKLHVKKLAPGCKGIWYSFLPFEICSIFLRQIIAYLCWCAVKNLLTHSFTHLRLIKLHTLNVIQKFGKSRYVLVFMPVSSYTSFKIKINLFNESFSPHTVPVSGLD